MFARKIHYASVVLLATLGVLPTSASAWYIRLDVAVPKAHLLDEGNALGQVHDAIGGYDLHDLIEFAPFGAPYLTLVFPHANWGSKAGNYATDFHAPSVLSDSWAFEVRTDAPNRTVTLNWSSDSNNKLKQSQLVDNTTGQTIAVKPNKHYTFTMTGQTTRSFTWKVNP